MWPQVHAGPQAEVPLSVISIGRHVSGVTRGLVSIVHSQLQFKDSVFPKGGPRSLKHSSASRRALALGQPESGARRRGALWEGCVSGPPRKPGSLILTSVPLCPGRRPPLHSLLTGCCSSLGASYPPPLTAHRSVGRAGALGSDRLGLGFDLATPTERDLGQVT